MRSEQPSLTVRNITDDIDLEVDPLTEKTSVIMTNKNCGDAPVKITFVIFHWTLSEY